MVYNYRFIINNLYYRLSIYTHSILDMPVAQYAWKINLLFHHFNFSSVTYKNQRYSDNEKEISAFDMLICYVIET